MFVLNCYDLNIRDSLFRVIPSDLLHTHQASATHYPASIIFCCACNTVPQMRCCAGAFAVCLKPAINSVLAKTRKSIYHHFFCDTHQWYWPHLDISSATLSNTVFSSQGRSLQAILVTSLGSLLHFLKRNAISALSVASLTVCLPTILSALIFSTHTYSQSTAPFACTAWHALATVLAFKFCMSQRPVAPLPSTSLPASSPYIILNGIKLDCGAQLLKHGSTEACCVELHSTRVRTHTVSGIH